MWETVHCASRVEPHVDPPFDHEMYEPERPDHFRRPWTCNGPGPLREEFVNEAGNRDIRTIEPCPDCDGGSHREHRVITLEAARSVG